MKAIALLILGAAFLTSCSSAGPKRVSAVEFKRQFAQVGMAQTMYAHTYLGERDGRAYIQVDSMSTLTGKWSKRVIYTDLSQLDPEFRNALPKTEMMAPL